MGGASLRNFFLLRVFFLSVSDVKQASEAVSRLKRKN